MIWQKGAFVGALGSRLGDCEIQDQRGPFWEGSLMSRPQNSTIVATTDPERALSLCECGYVLPPAKGPCGSHACLCLGYRQVEHNWEPRNKPIHIQTAHIWQGSWEDSVGKGSLFHRWCWEISTSFELDIHMQMSKKENLSYTIHKN